MWVIADGMVEGSVVVSVVEVRLRRVMGPEWSFWAAVMAEHVAGARVVVVDGSAIRRVEAWRMVEERRVGMRRKAWRVGIIVCRLFYYFI